MDKILAAIEEKIKLGYSEYVLRVQFGRPYDDSEGEGYYLAKLNGWGSIPITDVLAKENEVNDDQLIKQLNEMRIKYLW